MDVTFLVGQPPVGVPNGFHQLLHQRLVRCGGIGYDFGTIPVDIPVTVMNLCLANYQNATGWNRFTNYIGTY